jgi:MOSC domain-containing protein YiiM
VTNQEARVLAVCRDGEHRFSKTVVDEIVLMPGLGVQGDAHQGVTVQYRSRVAADPTQPNLRQVHLIHAELFAEVGEHGFHVDPGQLGENIITTRGIDLLSFPRGTLLQLGGQAVIKMTGLRNPCQQINAFQPGLLKEVLTRKPAGELVRKAGVMSVVVTGGVVRPGDPITTTLPSISHQPLDRV